MFTDKLPDEQGQVADLSASEQADVARILAQFYEEPHGSHIPPAAPQIPSSSPIQEESHLVEIQSTKRFPFLGISIIFVLLIGGFGMMMFYTQVINAKTTQNENSTGLVYPSTTPPVTIIPTPTSIPYNNPFSLTDDPVISPSSPSPFGTYTNPFTKTVQEELSQETYTNPFK